MNYQQEFYKTWQWISEKTQKLKRKVEKDKYFKHINMINKVHNNSYACEFAKSSFMMNENDNIGCFCKYCPLIWINGIRLTGYMCILDKDSIYDKWCYSQDWQESAKLAKEISLMQWRSNYEQI